MLRLATPSDCAGVASIYRPAVTDSAISFEYEPPDPAEMARRIETTLQRTPWIVCETGDGLLGYAYGTRHRERAAYQWSVEVSAYVRHDARRAGVATALYTSLFAVLILQGFRTAFAGITLPNPGSVALHEAVGFTPIGVFCEIGYKNGVWHDVAWLQRELAPHIPEPPLPTPLPDLLDSPALRPALETGLARLRLRA